MFIATRPGWLVLPCKTSILIGFIVIFTIFQTSHNFRHYSQNSLLFLTKFWIIFAELQSDAKIRDIFVVIFLKKSSLFSHFESHKISDLKKKVVDSWKKSHVLAQKRSLILASDWTFNFPVREYNCDPVFVH